MFKGEFKLNSIWISLLLSCLVLSVYILSRPEIDVLPSSGILELIEAKTLDLRFLLRGPRTPGDDIAIIAVDEKSEDELGRWQSSGRSWLAQMLDIIHEGGAKTIGFDLTLAEPDKGAALEAIDAVQEHYLKQQQQPASSAQADTSATLPFLDSLRTTYDYDRQLANAIQNVESVVLGYYLFWDRTSAEHLDEEQRKAHSQLLTRVKYNTLKFSGASAQAPLRARKAYGVEPNLPIFSDAANSLGFFTIIPDSDGYIRKAVLLAEYKGNYYPSLALELSRNYLAPPMPPIIHATAKEDEGLINGIQLGRHYIPTNERGELLINFYGPRHTFPYYSLSDVLLGRIPPQTFKDKILLLGFTSTVYQDVHSVPFQEGTFPGVEVHATIVENILRQDFLTRPEWAALLDAAFIFLLGIVLGPALHWTHSLRQELSGLILSLTLVFVAAYAAFSFWSIWLNVTFPWIFVLLNYLLVTSYKYLTEEKQRKAIRHAFEHYVSPSVVKNILEHSERPELGQEPKVLSALFSDIRGFTELAEGMNSTALTEFLTEFFTPMTEIIVAHGGTVDKYIGDAIMVFYGAPAPQEDHAARACKTAVEMMIKVEELRARWRAEGMPEIKIGLGINSGEMSVGNIGSLERFDYTIIGDNVNLASRLEGTNKQYGTNIIISQFTYDMLPKDNFTVRELDTVRVKGKKEPVTIYELLGYDEYFPQLQELSDLFHQGLTAYKQQQWDEAIAAFQTVLEKYPDDAPAKLYIKRCKDYRFSPPPDDWDGVFVMTSK